MAWKFLLTLAIALAGTYIFLKRKVPAGAFVGAVIFVGVVQIATGILHFPPAIKTLGSALAGSYLGTRVRRSDLIALKKAPLAAVLMVAVMICYNIFSGWLLSVTTDLDFGSALLGMAPGGSTEFSLVAADMGYNPATVTILQMLRMAVIVPLIPVSVKFILSHFGDKIRQKEHREEKEVRRPKHRNTKGFLMALAIGMPAGLLGKYLEVPAGAICFSMFAVGLVNVITDKMYFPLPARYFANSCNGAIIGVKLALSDIIMVGKALPVVLLIDVSWVILSGIMGMVIYQLSEFSLATSLFAGSPGGMSDMGLIAEDLGGNPTQVTVMQLCRLVCVLSFIPFILHHLL